MTKLEIECPTVWAKFCQMDTLPWYSVVPPDKYCFRLPPSQLYKFADDSTATANGSTWQEAKFNLDTESDFYKQLNTDNLMTLDPCKSKTIPIIPPNCATPDCPIRPVQGIFFAMKGTRLALYVRGASQVTRGSGWKLFELNNYCFATVLKYSLVADN